MAKRRLFDQARLTDWLDSLKKDCASEVGRAGEDEVLGAVVDEWAVRLASKYSVEMLVVHLEQMEAVDHGEKQVDVRNDQNRAIWDRSKPALVPGRKVVVRVPFSGDSTLLRVQPSQFTMSPPRAAIKSEAIEIVFEYPSDKPPNIGGAVDALVSEIQRHLEWQKADVQRHNDSLKEVARQNIEQRRTRVLGDRQHLDGLGIPVKRAVDGPSTYAAPGIVRRRSPTNGSTRADGVAVPMHPTLVGEFYDHIVGVVAAMARGMERTPADYAGWTEEQLRDALLVLLNTHYEGQATGETFNRSGKTDILVRSGDSNVFVGECKWWSGPKAFAGVNDTAKSALDQLLSYATWRDAKLALIVFVRAQGIDGVIESARTSLAEHQAFVGEVPESHEGLFRARVRMPVTDDREADLAVIFVHLPGS